MPDIPYNNPLRAPDETYREQLSPIRDMNYFDGINTIRNERFWEHQNDQFQDGGRQDLLTAIVQRSREILASSIKPRTKRTGKGAPDGFASVNMLQGVSKYDLDRGTIDIKALNAEKRRRMEVNAKMKKERQDAEDALVAKRAVINKVKKIRDESVFREKQLAAHKEMALRN